MTVSNYNYNQLAEDLGITTNDLKKILGASIYTNNTIMLTEEKVEKARLEVQQRDVENAENADRVSEEEALEEAFPADDVVDDETADDVADEEASE